jgi:hypothetical protein
MRSITTLSAIAASSGLALASPYATSVVSYDQGANPTFPFTDDTTALGSPERFTGEGQFPSGVTPFNPAFGADELVSVGAGGHLALGFDREITNSASNPFGIDFIVFSNAGFLDASYTDEDDTNDGTGLTGTNPFLFGAGGAATIQVSVDATNWLTVTTTTLDLFPTLGYQDYAAATPGAPGTIETDFTQAMDPSIALGDLANLTFDQLRAIYGSSGGGIGIDIDSTGLESVNYVRFLNESDTAFEIDAVAVVPAPGAMALLTLTTLGATRRRRA